MQFDDLRIFVATVEAGSFTGAADKLLLSKQFVSRRVMALEASLGVRLLVRNTRKLAVTELGQEFHARATRILAEIAETEEAMSARRGDLRGTLKISAPMSFGIARLSPLIAEFLVQHPAVRLHVELSDRHVDLIGEGFDLALRIGALPDSTLIARRLGALRMVACCSPAYRRKRGAPATPADLHAHVCLLYGQEGRTGWEFAIDGARRTFEVQGALLANNGDVIRDAAVAGLGIALLPHFIVEPALDAGQLVAVLEPFAQAPLPVNAVYPQHRQDMSACRVFLGFIEERLRERFSRCAAATRAVGWLGGWVVGWLGGWVVGPLGRWAVGPLGRWAVGPLGRWAVGQSGNRAVGQSGSRAVGQSSGRAVDWEAGPFGRCAALPRLPIPSHRPRCPGRHGKVMLRAAPTIPATGALRECGPSVRSRPSGIAQRICR